MLGGQMLCNKIIKISITSKCSLGIAKWVVFNGFISTVRMLVCVWVHACVYWGRHETVVNRLAVLKDFK